MGDVWHIVEFDVDAEKAGLLAELMRALGSNGSIEEQSHRDNCVRLLSYFDADAFKKSDILSKIKQTLKGDKHLNGSKPKLKTSILTDWSLKWRQWFQPFEIVPEVAVVPTWEKYKATSELVILMDPGMAFGTGLHATTKLCAMAIKDASLKTKGLSLLDVGTGSGILSILAAKLGFKKILTVENDPEAAKVARKNFRLNKVGNIKVLENISKTKGTFDVVVANILLNTNIELKDKLIRCMKRKGIIVLSGITHDQERDIKSAFGHKLTLVDSARLDEWSSLTFCKKE